MKKPTQDTYVRVETQSNRQLITDLQLKARATLDPLISENSTISLLDFPNNSNVGDSLIWLGETEYLSSRGLKPSYISDCRNYDPRRIEKTLKANPLILLNGGGYFGSLWPELQSFRIKVLRDFPGVPVVQFPQSIHFSESQSLSETTEAIRIHGNYTLLVRDLPSFNFAKEHFACSVQLCPDMAFFIGAIEPKNQPQFDRFILSRTDIEKSSNWLDKSIIKNQIETIYESDWLKPGLLERIYTRIEKHTVDVRKLLDPNNRLLFILWNLLATARLKRGQALLEKGRVVIADRLHVHILSVLLSKPHVLLDNSYKKLANLHAAWTAPCQTVKFVESLPEAFLAARVLDEKSRNIDSFPSSRTSS